MTARLPTPTMSASITPNMPAPRAPRKKEPRAREERYTITLDRYVVGRFTAIAKRQGRGRYEVINEALRAAAERIEQRLSR